MLSISKIMDLKHSWELNERTRSTADAQFNSQIFKVKTFLMSLVHTMRSKWTKLELTIWRLTATIWVVPHS